MVIIKISSDRNDIELKVCKWQSGKLMIKGEFSRRKRRSPRRITEASWGQFREGPRVLHGEGEDSEGAGNCQPIEAARTMYIDHYV